MINYLSKIYEESEIPKFQNILTYYQFFGTEVIFSNTKLIFAVHVPIIRNEVLTFYRLYPIIQNHHIFIPKYPYLARTASKIQFKSNICPLLEKTYFCTEDYYPEDHCTAQLIEGDTTANCQSIQINLAESIIEQITQEEVLIIPVREERILSKCKTDRHMEINLPTLIKIPENCEIHVNRKKFVNNIRVQHGKPLILPKLQIEDIGTPMMYKTPNFTKINLDEIYEINKMADRLTPITKPEPSNNHTTVFGILIGLILLILVLVIAINTHKKWRATTWCRPKSNETEGGQDAEMVPQRQNKSIIFSS